MLNKQISHQSGRSMIEMLGVLAIVGVLSIGALKGFSMAMATAKANKSMQRLSEIATGIYDLYANRKNYDGINLELIKNAGIIREEEYYALDASDPTELTANLSAGYISNISTITVTTPEGTFHYFILYFIVPVENKILCHKTFEWANTNIGYIMSLRSNPSGMGKSRSMYIPVSMSDIVSYCDKDNEWGFRLYL